MDYSNFFNKSQPQSVAKTSTTQTPKIEATQQDSPPTQAPAQYTEGDKRYIQFVKSKGATAEQAFKGLQTAKANFGDGGAALDAFENAMKDSQPITLGNMLTGAGKGVLSTVEGGMNLFKGGMNALGMQTASQTAGTDTGEIIPEDWRTPKGAGESLGFGMEQIGEFLIPAGGITKVGKIAGAGIKGTGMGAKIAKGAIGLGIESAAIAGQSGLQKGKVPTLEDFTWAFGTGAAIKGIASLAKAMVSPAALKTYAKWAGNEDDVITAVSEKTGKNTFSKVGEKVINQLDEAKASKNRFKTTQFGQQKELPSPLMQVGQKQLKPAVVELNKIKTSTGKELSGIIKNTKTQVFTDKTLKGFEKKIKDLGGQVTKDGVVFGPTSAISGTGDVAALNDIYKTLKAYSTKTMPLEEAWRLRQRIDGLLEAGQKGLVTVTKAAQIPLKATRVSLRNLITKTAPESKKLFAQYAKQIEILDFFNRKLGRDSSSASVLKNILSPLAKDQTVPMLNKLKAVTGKDIILEARAAKLAMDVVGDNRAATLLGVMSSGSAKQGAFNAFKSVILNPEKRIVALFKALRKTPPKEGSKEMQFLMQAMASRVPSLFD